jgi:hypothetical protein
MSEQPLSANPEFLLHYQRLRRDRAWMRRRAYVLLIAAGGLLASVIIIVSTASSLSTVGPGFLILFIGLALLLIWNAVVAFKRSSQPIDEQEVARIRQEERQQLFQFAQGRISWRYWVGVVTQFLIGLLFLFLGVWAALSLMSDQTPLIDGILSLAFISFAWYSLSQAMRSARLLRRLAKLSGQELAARLSLGEATEGE